MIRVELPAGPKSRTLFQQANTTGEKYAGRRSLTANITCFEALQTIDFFDSLGDPADMTANYDADKTWLVSDLGATTCRIGLFVPANDQITAIRVFRNDEYADLAELLGGYLNDAGTKPTNCTIAVAAAVDGDHVRMCNRDWQFSGKDVARQFGFERIGILNDFHALAYGLPELTDKDRAEIGRATQYRKGNIAVLGPGSGLGMSAWIQSHGSTSVMCGEGGHITVAGRNSLEDDIIANLRARFGHCSAERILSGPGLLALHHAMHNINLDSPEMISENLSDSNCNATMQQFFRFLGGAAADLALITGAYGGVYVAGGIVPNCVEQLAASEFRSRFEDKNRYADYMRAIPTWVITAPEPGLTSLGAFIKHIIGQGSSAEF